MIFYSSFYDACKILSPEDKAKAYEAIIEYGCAGKLPENIPPIVQAIFIMAKPTIDAAEQKRENGKKGGRPRKDAGKFINFQQSGTDWDAVAEQITAKEAK